MEFVEDGIKIFIKFTRNVVSIKLTLKYKMSIWFFFAVKKKTLNCF